jgi:hypothetical protein
MNEIYELPIDELRRWAYDMRNDATHNIVVNTLVARIEILENKLEFYERRKH